MKAIKWTDTEIVNAIKEGGRKRQEAIHYIYNDKAFSGKVIQFVKANSGNMQDGQDMFHEGIIVMDRNIRQDKFREESSIKGYLYSICRFLWMNQIRKNAKVDLKEDNHALDQTETVNPENLMMGDEKKALLDQVLTQLGDRCKKILELWKLSYSMEEIAEEMDFSSPAMARKNKYRCHKSLLQLLENQPKLMQFLKH